MQTVYNYALLIARANEIEAKLPKLLSNLNTLNDFESLIKVLRIPSYMWSSVAAAQYDKLCISIIQCDISKLLLIPNYIRKIALEQKRKN